MFLVFDKFSILIEFPLKKIKKRGNPLCFNLYKTVSLHFLVYCVTKGRKGTKSVFYEQGQHHFGKLSTEINFRLRLWFAILSNQNQSILDSDFRLWFAILSNQNVG